MSFFDGFERRDPLMGADHFALIGRPTIAFKVVRLYNAAGFIPSVYGITLDGKSSTCARVVDVLPLFNVEG